MAALTQTSLILSTLVMDTVTGAETETAITLLKAVATAAAMFSVSGGDDGGGSARGGSGGAPGGGGEGGGGGAAGEGGGEGVVLLKPDAVKPPSASGAPDARLACSDAIAALAVGSPPLPAEKS